MWTPGGGLQTEVKTRKKECVARPCCVLQVLGMHSRGSFTSECAGVRDQEIQFAFAENIRPREKVTITQLLGAESRKELRDPEGMSKPHSGNVFQMSTKFQVLCKLRSMLV